MSSQEQIAPSETFEASRSVVATEQADMAILMDLRTGRYFTLNPVGGVIWSELASGSTVGQMTSRLTGAYEVSAQQAMLDVQEILSSMLAAKLIKKVR
ncbi:MAG: PqqD family peptide modification chaperone [Acidobacteriota bacterium]